MADYEGMRWFKCDFQVQTPEDAAHWADEDTRLLEPRRAMVRPAANADGQVGQAKPDESRLQDLARIYLRRCHEVGLELICVTDHNFSQKTEPRDWFLTHLVEQNKSVARELRRAPLFILPGFEVDIGYHVLCLFEPARKERDIRRVNKLLCKLGLDEAERFTHGQPRHLRRAGANVSLKELVGLVQGEHNGIVIAAHADQTDGILENARNAEDYKNKLLLAIEVTSSPPARRVLDVVEGHNRIWSRSNCQPACVMSSDAKSLRVDAEGKPIPNSLGYRYTWLKMSKPSIEALRQAFLDPQSRIRLMGSRPSDTQVHPRITKIAVRGAKFLDDQEVLFSESLNCVIGGRGSGKSSLLEYVRFAIGLDDLAIRPDDEDATLKQKRAQLMESLTNDSEVRVSFEVGNGVSDTLVYAPGRPKNQQRWLEGREVADLNTVLRQLQLQFFSQGELSRMTSGPRGQSQVLSLIDNASGRDLQELKKSERDLKARLTSLFQSTRDATRLRAEVGEAKQETIELDRQLRARAAVQTDSELNQLATAAQRYLDRMQQDDEPVTLAIEQIIEGLVRPLEALPENAVQWPNAQWFSDTTVRVQQARVDLASAIRTALADYQKILAVALSDAETQPTRDAIREAHEKYRVACTERGIREDDIARVQELEEKRQAKLKVAEERQARLDEVEAEAVKFPHVLSELHAVWRAQYEARRQTAEGIQASVASQTLRLTTSFMADEASFEAAWARLSPSDKRIKLARRWDELGKAVYSKWKSTGELSPWECVELTRANPLYLDVLFSPGFEDLHTPLFAHLDSNDVRPIWEDVRISRVSDGVDVELLRDDGSIAGSMKGTLSEGQRNTVLLNLMLARGEGPIVIDQPEDELDSSFIYRTLVQDLRAVKTKRQLIVATHNANLPVNADSEQIYALEAREGRGKLCAQGGLDRKSVAAAVLDIMEGSEQAFKQRSEKYHF